MNSKRQDLLRRHVERLERRLEHLEGISRRFSSLRLLTALVMLISGVLAFTVEPSSVFPVILGVSVLSFMLLIIWHERLKRGIKAFKLWRQIKQMHIARMTLDWEGLPEAAAAEPLPDHPYELDLDITGERSLHRLLDTAVTREGSDRLRGWLLTTPDVAAMRRRQELVKELKTIPVFGDKLTLYGMGGSRQRTGGFSWLEGKQRVDRRILVALLVFALVNLLLLLGDALGVVAPVWRLTMPAYFIAFVLASRSIGDIFQDSLAVRASVERFNAVFRHLEASRSDDLPQLRKLCAPFLDAANRPTRQLVFIRWLLFAASLRSNLVLWLPLNLLLPWDMLVAWGLDVMRSRLRLLLPQWLDVWFELEALSSLASYAYLHPDAVFPVLDEDTVFDGQALGHPLIREGVKVRNDFAMQGTGKLVIITGSNMSGKSSFLRTAGLALCMAYAGGVVDASALRVSVFRLYTCIRVSDSVVEGFSYFYAEVRRLKLLLDALDAESAYPLFFLIDEIFKGTNNRERLIGSRAYIRALVGKKGLGFISTHDLELVQLADEFPGIRNVHFREQIVDGSMVFDYRLREGASPTTNALKIMRLAGLPVDEETPDASA